jgi:hypothetical protein
LLTSASFMKSPLLSFRLLTASDLSRSCLLAY